MYWSRTSAGQRALFVDVSFLSRTLHFQLCRTGSSFKRSTLPAWKYVRKGFFINVVVAWGNPFSWSFKKWTFIYLFICLFTINSSGNHGINERDSTL